MKKRGKMLTKLNLSFAAIAVVLLISSVITILEYRRMSSYMSSLISNDVHCINIVRSLGDVSSEYNHDILAVIGDGPADKAPDFDAASFKNGCDSLREFISYKTVLELTDSVECSFATYLQTSRDLDSVVVSDFINTREWYFETLQPRYDKFHNDLDELRSSLYANLHRHTMDFDSGFYRSIIPSSVSVLVALLLVIMLHYFLNSYYTRPLLAIHKALHSYRSYNKKYSCDFEGDDELQEINEGIRELCDENQTLRGRVAQLRKDKPAPEDVL